LVFSLYNQTKSSQASKQASISSGRRLNTITLSYQFYDIPLKITGMWKYMSWFDTENSIIVMCRRVEKELYRELKKGKKEKRKERKRKEGRKKRLLIDRLNK
jgi:hypothetical protein